MKSIEGKKKKKKTAQETETKWFLRSIFSVRFIVCVVSVEPFQTPVAWTHRHWTWSISPWVCGRWWTSSQAWVILVDFSVPSGEDMEESYLLGAGCALLCYSIKLRFQDAACPRRLRKPQGAWHKHHHLPSSKLQPILINASVLRIETGHPIILSGQIESVRTFEHIKTLTGKPGLGTSQTHQTRDSVEHPCLSPIKW